MSSRCFLVGSIVLVWVALITALAGVYYAIEEHVNYTNSVYTMVMNSTTIGSARHVPTSEGSEWFLIFANVLLSIYFLVAILYIFYLYTHK